MPWYGGPTLLNVLETVHIGSDRNLIDFRLPIQLVCRPHLNFRGFQGSIAAGRVSVGDEICVATVWQNKPSQRNLGHICRDSS